MIFLYKEKVDVSKIDGQNYLHIIKNNSNSNYQFHVQYETSKSEHNDLSNKTAFVDSVSSFPYYDIPKNAKDRCNS